MKTIKPNQYSNNKEEIVDSTCSNVKSTNDSAKLIQDQQRGNVSAKMCSDLKNEINQLILKIRTNVENSDPEKLMNYITFKNFNVQLEKKTDCEFQAEEIYQLRATDYVQSVLVSSPNHPVVILSETEEENLFQEILADTCLLYEKIGIFYMLWGSQALQDTNISDEEKKYILSAQFMSLIRGKQYQSFRLDILNELLKPHNDELNEAYGIEIEELMRGLSLLEKNLSSGRLNALRTLHDQQQLFNWDSDNIPENTLNQIQETMNKAIGLELFDIKKTTHWPDLLIEDLTYELGADQTFFNHDEFPGWPIWNLPVQLKPCIRINNVAYTFDYYNFFDNFYRAFQKAIVKRLDDGTKKWKETQTYASETIVGRIFEELLPGCMVHRNNYYPLQKRNSAESDLIIQFKDTCIIVEVKAGSFTYTPAITDLIAHKKSLISLVEKAEKQCFRTKEYIENNECSIFYDSNNLTNETFRLNRSDFTQIYMVDVTVDDFNEIAAQMEKIHIIDTKENIIAISLNDLWIYKEYFDNPFVFIHFLKQRTLATTIKEISPLDELDHLGLYINLNVYSLYFQQLKNKFTKIHISGCREDLDLYFNQDYLRTPTKKPQQEMPEEIYSLLNICKNLNNCQVTLFTNFLLDMSSESKENYCNNIHLLSKKESELGGMFPVITSGNLSYCLWVRKDGIRAVSSEYCKDYVLAFLAKNQNPYCYLIEIVLNDREQIIDVNFAYLTQQDIPLERKEELYKKGTIIANNRTQNYLAKHHKKKIGRNELCLCGSGKKYKKCCGK